MIEPITERNERRKEVLVETPPPGVLRLHGIANDATTDIDALLKEVERLRGEVPVAYREGWLEHAGARGLQEPDLLMNDWHASNARKRLEPQTPEE